MGAHNKKGNDATAQDIEIETIIMHRLYKKPFGMSHDIALVKLSRPAEINRAVRLACLPDASVDLPIDDGSKTCWITGIFTINILGSNLWEFLFTATPVGHFGTIPF